MDLGSHITETPSSKGLRAKGDMQWVVQEESGVAASEQTLTPLGWKSAGAVLVGYKRERMWMGPPCTLVRGWPEAGRCRDHHGADHVHHHHRCERLHAPRVLHQGRGHLPLGQLRLRVPVGAGVRGRQLPDHGAGAQGAGAAAEGERSSTPLLLGALAVGWVRLAGGRKGRCLCKRRGTHFRTGQLLSQGIPESSSCCRKGSQKVASLWTKAGKTWVLDLSSATSLGPQVPHLF